MRSVCDDCATREGHEATLQQGGIQGGQRGRTGGSRCRVRFVIDCTSDRNDPCKLERDVNTCFVGEAVSLFPENIANIWKESFKPPSGSARALEANGADGEQDTWTQDGWCRLAGTNFALEQNHKLRKLMRKRDKGKHSHYTFESILDQVSRFVDEKSLTALDNPAIILPSKQLRAMIGKIGAIHWSRLPLAILARIGNAVDGASSDNHEVICGSAWGMGVEVQSTLLAMPNRDLVPLMDWKITKDTGRFSSQGASQFFHFHEIIATIHEYIAERKLQTSWCIVETTGTYLQQALGMRRFDRNQIPELVFKNVTWNRPVIVTWAADSTGRAPILGKRRMCITEHTVLRGIRSVKTTGCCWCGKVSGRLDEKGVKIQLYKCAECMAVKYCGKQCQSEDWQRHYAECRSVVEENYWSSIAGTPADEVD